MTCSITHFIDLESSLRRVRINPLGAELTSLVSQQTGDEFMWAGDPKIWSGVAPLLFPIVGGLRDDSYQFDNNTYKLKKHGFARQQSFSLVSKDTSAALLKLDSNPETMAAYPWQFELLVAFSITDNELSITYEVRNLSATRMAYNIGSHPAFRLPLEDTELEHYSVQFSEKETLDCFSVVDGVLARTPRPYLKNETLIPLTRDLFVDDALVFRDIKSSSIELVHRDHGTRIRVATGGAPHLGIWAKPAAPYVCIEPWWGHADFEDSHGDLTQKESIQFLEPDQTFKTSITISTFDQAAILEAQSRFDDRDG